MSAVCSHFAFSPGHVSILRLCNASGCFSPCPSAHNMLPFSDTGLAKPAWPLFLVHDGSAIPVERIQVDPFPSSQSRPLWTSTSWANTKQTLDRNLGSQAGCRNCLFQCLPVPSCSGGRQRSQPGSCHPGEGEGHIPCPETWRDKAETLQRNTPRLELGKHKDLRLPLGATHLGQDQGKEMENVTHAMSLV